MDTLLSGHRDSIQTEIVGKLHAPSFGHQTRPSQTTMVSRR